MMNFSSPVFEIRLEDGKHIEIYANGRIEGLRGVVINRLPLFAGWCAEETRKADAALSRRGAING
jgi:hypothetical protein